MKTHHVRGPAGVLETRVETPSGAPRGVAVISHPHPMYGGTFDNAVVRQTVACTKAAGLLAASFNFRGVGMSAGNHDGDVGELEDLEAVVTWLANQHQDLTNRRLVLAGYSFGARVTLSWAATKSPSSDHCPCGLLIIAPPLTLGDFSFVANNEAPIALLTGEEDALTPRAELARVRRQWQNLCCVETIPGVGHDLGTANLTSTAEHSDSILAAAIDRALSQLF